MLLKELGEKLNRLIFGKITDMSLRRKIYILLTFLSSFILLFGLISNIAVGLNIYADIVNFISLILVFSLYFIARNREHYRYTILPLFILSLVLLTIGWFVSSGYDGNLPSLFFLFFTSIYVIVNVEHRKFVLIFYTTTYASLILIQYINPHWIINYDNPQQRFIDLFIGGIIYSISMYFIIDIIIQNYKVEIDKNKQINRELIEKNIEIAQSKSKLEESYERLSIAMISSKQGWFDLDIPSGRVEVSQEYPNLIGYTYEEFDTSFQNWIMNIHPNDVQEVLETFNKAMHQKTTSTTIYRRKTKSGKWIWMQSVGKVVEYDEAGNPKRLIGTHMDISEQKKAEQALRESEEKYRSLFDTMPNGFYRSTPDGYFVDANPTLIKMLGYDSLEELSKVHIPTEIYVEESERNDFQVNNTEFTNQLETYRLMRRDGEIVWFEDNARYIKDSDGKILFHEGIIKDITDRKKAEAELKESEESLKKLNATKDKFFSIIAHDLRNPLGNFVSVLSYLYEFYNVLSEEEKIEYISNTKDSASGLFSLLENLLEWSRSQRGMIIVNPNEFCIRMIADNTQSILKLSADAKNIRLENKIPEATIVNTDANLVSTIIRNLTSNAIKFTPKGGIIEVGIEKSDDQKITVYLRDSGVGMSKETIDKLFRIDQSVTTEGTTGEKGTGLGLILCKEFAEKLGGNIWVESEVGQGTTFYFTLPNIVESVSNYKIRFD